MLKGIYRYSGSAAELSAARRLRAACRDPEQFEARGQLAVVCEMPGARVTVDGLRCAFDGRLYGEGLVDRTRPSAAGERAAEAVARRFRRAGEGALRELRGSFAFALWDEKRQEGLLGSDLLATRSLFLWRGSGYLAFAGELTELLEMLPSSPGPDPDGFLSWLGGWTVPADRTLYEGVSRLPPGHLVDLAGQASIRRHWYPAYEAPHPGSRAELAEGLRTEVERAVSRRLSPRSSGVVLSGGLDSSMVTAAASRVNRPGAELRTYSAVFPGAEYDEAWKVRSLTAALEIDPGLFELRPQGGLWLGLRHLQRWGMPLMSNALLIDVAMVEAAGRDGVEVVMEGQTGDELFGSSPWIVADRLMRGRLLAALELARNWPGRTTSAREQRYILRRWGLKGAAPHWLSGLARRRRDPSAAAPTWLRPELHGRYAALEDRWAWKAAGSGPRWWRYLADRLVQAPQREMRLDYLRNRAAAAGSTSETPFYDVDLIEYCLRLPPELAFDSAFNRPLARESMRGLIPDEVRLDGRKAVFSPFCFDMVTGADAPGLESLLTAPDAELGAYVDLEMVRRLWHVDRPRREPRYGTMDWGSDVWRLAAAESWLRAQADPEFVERMLARPDVLPPAARALAEQPA